MTIDSNVLLIVSVSVFAMAGLMMMVYVAWKIFHAYHDTNNGMVAYDESYHGNIVWTQSGKMRK